MFKPRPGKVLPVNREMAETLALQALGFLAGDAPRLGRFLALTGLEAEDLRARAGSPDVLAAVLAHLLADESLLLMFTSETHTEPERIAPALEILQREAGP
jgi:hypothetical protein